MLANSAWSMKVMAIMLICGISPSVFGADGSCDSGRIAIGFFNGVNTSIKDARNASGYLSDELERNKYKKFQVQLFYNYSNGLMSDLAEVFDQRMEEQDPVLQDHMELFWESLNGAGALSEQISLISYSYQQMMADFTVYATNQVAKALAGAASILNNKGPATAVNYGNHRKILDANARRKTKLLMVAHSQGNLFAVNAYDYVKTNYGAKNAAVVHVAPASTVLRGPHILADKDEVINLLRSTLRVPDATHQIPSFMRRPSGINGHIDALGHGFLEIYLNPAFSTSSTLLRDIDVGVNNLKLNNCQENGDAKKQILVGKPVNFSVLCGMRSCMGETESIMQFLRQNNVVRGSFVRLREQCYAAAGRMMMTFTGTYNKSRNVYRLACKSSIKSYSAEEEVSVVIPQAKKVSRKQRKA